VVSDRSGGGFDPMADDEPLTLMISALQHYAFCPRQFALIHVEQAWADNRFTAEGTLLHTRVDSGSAEQRKTIRFERGVMVKSKAFGLTGKMDLLEIISGDPQTFFPVEYKRGKPKVHDWDRIQLCAQGLCLEEMRNVKVEEGAIWYWEARKRETVRFDAALREATITAIIGARKILAMGVTPSPTSDVKRCRACSLKDLCEPQVFRKDLTAQYMRGLFELF